MFDTLTERLERRRPRKGCVDAAHVEFYGVFNRWHDRHGGQLTEAHRLEVGISRVTTSGGRTTIEKQVILRRARAGSKPELVCVAVDFLMEVEHP